MGVEKRTPSTAWRRGMFVLYGLGTWIALCVIAGSLRWIDWFWPLMIGIYGVGAWLIAWFVASIVGLVRYRSVWPYIVAPAVVFGSIGALHVSGLPQYAQFALSKSALTAAAAACTPADDVRIGAYLVERVAPLHGACLFYLPGSFLDRYGLAVMPDGPFPDERRQSNLSTTHVTGEFYRFVEHF